MIKTKYYSDLTKKFYDVQDEAEKEEQKEREKNALELKKKEERTAEAKKVEDLFKVASDAYKTATDALSEFCKKYPGGYHFTVTDTSRLFPNLFDYLFKDFWM